MTRQTMFQAKKESQPLKKTSSLFRRQAAQTPAAEQEPAFPPIHLGQDHSAIPFKPVHPAPALGPSSISCPFTPERCPFGGACHACPPKMQMQAKLKIGQPGDKYEQEADRVAEQVMRMPEPQVQRKCSAPGCKDEEEKKLLQTKPAGSAGNAQVDHPLIQNVLASPGQPLDAGTRSFMEPRFGQDFSGVRVHTDSEAAESVRAVNARAYTVGRDVVFGEGQYAPGSDEGRRLVAHELTHAIQQERSSAAIQRRLLGDDLSMEDPIHGPLLDAFSRETGAPRDHASQHSPAYEAWLIGHEPEANPTDVLNHAQYTSLQYSSTVSAWSDNSPIWPVLTTRQARINFVRFILSFDETNCVPLAGQTTPRANCSATAAAVAAFSNACQGYASQMYARYTNMDRLPPADTASLETDARVIVGNVPAKFHIPIRIATVPGHAFNAILIAADPADVNSWLFVEPQTDEIFFASDPRMTSVTDIYAGSGVFTLSRLTGYNNRGFQQTDERSFLSSSAGTFTHQVLSTQQRMFLDNFLRDIFIADDHAAFPFYTSHHNPPQTYEQLIASYSSTSSANLALAFTVINGRSFRRVPKGATEIMTRAVYLQLINKPGLDILIPP